MSCPYRSIVVANEDRAHCSKVAHALRYIGRTVVGEDGWDSLKLILGGTHDLLILFPALNGMGAEGVIRLLRNDPKYSTFPIVCVGLDPNRLADDFGDDDCLFPVDHLAGDMSNLVFATMRAISRASEHRWSSRPEPERAFLSGCQALFEALTWSVGKFDAVRLQQLQSVTEALVANVQEGRVRTLMEALDEHDDFTLVHSMRVAVLLVAFGVSLKMSYGDTELLAKAGLLHDVGKLAMPAAILTKPGPLDPEEWAVMRSHPVRGHTLLASIPQIPSDVALAARNHHEHLDGSGYPSGLSGNGIDDLSLVVAVADVYSALTDRRPYKPPMRHDKAVEVMRGLGGKHLEPHFTSHFLRTVEP